MINLIGIGKSDIFWYFCFYNLMICVNPFSIVKKRPVIYYYNKEKFQFNMEKDNIKLEWFIGITFNT